MVCVKKKITDASMKKYGEWKYVKEKFLELHDLDYAKAAETLCSLTYTGGTSRKQSKEEYTEMLSGRKYMKKYLYRIMKDYATQIKYKEKLKDYTHRFKVLMDICNALNIETPYPAIPPPKDIQP